MNFDASNSVLVVIGTRPELIKMAPIFLYLKNSSIVDPIFCSTGQHKDLLVPLMDFFDINFDYDLKIMKGNQSLSHVITATIKGVEDIIKKEKPALVLVHGDTATSFAAATASYMNKVPVAHVEAGLRTNNISSPWPEEGNRQLISRLTDLNFCPTKSAQENLLAEGISKESIFVTGNTVIDALFLAVNKIDASSSIRTDLIDKYEFLLAYEGFILVTGHRRENFGEGIEHICQALAQLGACRPNLAIVYPVHPNPNIARPVREALSNFSNVFLLEPLPYSDFVFLMRSALLILTDSGGIQEEAPSLNTPVLIMRDTTERPEAVNAGAALLVGSSTERILNNVNTLLDDPDKLSAMSQVVNPFGDGRASERICSEIDAFMLRKLKIEH